MIHYNISDSNLKLIDSYKVSKWDFSKELNNIKKESLSSKVWVRGIPQMCLEWSTHNFFYNINIKRESTKDCDLNYPQSFLERLGYAIVGCLVWLFIK